VIAWSAHVLAWALLTLAAGEADAQVRASVFVESDHRLRGLSLSDARPAFGANLGFDDASGAYVGGTLVGQDTDSDSGLRTIGDTLYAGYARRLAPGQSWDVGVSSTEARVYDGQPYSLRYAEVYAGYSRDNLVARLSYSPNYFAHGAKAAYFEVNDSYRPAEDWRLFGHAGLLTPLGGGPAPSVHHAYVDLRAGVARQFNRLELYAAWTASYPQREPANRQNRPALVAGATLAF